MYFLSGPLALVSTSRMLLTKNDESGHFYLVPEIRGKGFSVFPQSAVLALGFSKMPLIRLRKIPSITSLLRVF